MRDGGFVRLAGLLHLVQPGLGRTELLPEGGLGGKGFQQCLGVCDSVGIPTDSQARCQGIAANRVSFRIETQDAIVKEDDGRLRTVGAGSLLEQINELNLDFDVIRAEFEVLPQVMNGRIGLPGFYRTIGLRPECNGDAIRLDGVNAKDRTSDREDHEDKSE
jgi:hypothetical protein